MDAERFDGLVRDVADKVAGRRLALRVVVGAGLAVAFARTAPAAACQRKRRQCGGKKGTCCGNLRCCKGRCRDVGSDRDFCGGCRTACNGDAGQSCQSGACTCADGRPACGVTCCAPNCSCVGNGFCSCPIVKV